MSKNWEKSSPIRMTLIRYKYEFLPVRTAAVGGGTDRCDVLGVFFSLEISKFEFLV